MNTALLASWLPLYPVAALLLLAVYAPGTGLLLLLKARPAIAVAGGPLVTAAVLGFGGFALGSLGIPYGWPGFLLLCAFIWALGLLLRAIVVRSGGDHGEHQRPVSPARLRRPRNLFLLAAAAIALGTLWLPVGVSIDPELPNPRVDPMYHYNALHAILETGNVSMNSAVDYNYGLRVGHVVYPTVWHAMAALGVPLVGIVPAANAFTFLVVPVIFVVGIGLLVHVVLRRSAVATAAGVMAAGSLPAFPTGIVLVRAFWPDALATAMLPGMLVMVILYLRRVRWTYLRRSPWVMLLDTSVVLVAALGLGFTHPAVLISCMIIVVPLLFSAALKAQGVVRRTMSRRVHRLFVVMLIAIPLVAVVMVMIPQRTRSYLLRSGDQSWDGLLLKGVSLLVDWPTDASSLAGIVVALVYLPLLLGGLVLLARNRSRRWITISWSVGVAITAGSYVPLPVLTGLSGLWYADTYRLFAVQAAILPLAVAALAEWACAGGLRRRRRRVVVVWTLIACALLGTTFITGRQSFAVASMRGPLSGEQELDFLRRIGTEIPPGSVVIGDPASGVAYLPLESPVESVFTQVNLRDVDRDGIFLATDFDRIHEDPRVCQLLEYYGIGYFYEDAPLRYNYRDRAEAVPGLYGVETDRGFTLVDRQGTASLWRIDACGPIEPPRDWWTRGWRREGIVEQLDDHAHSGNPAQPGSG